MTADQIRALVRRDIREPSAVTIGNTQIDDVVALGGDVLWAALVNADQTFGKDRVSLTSTTHVFDLPSNCMKIQEVSDMRTTADSVEAASNASNIELTMTAHAFADDMIVRVHDVAGNTAANGTWLVDNKATDTIELSGSTGNASYTSGGKCFQEKSGFRKMVEIAEEDANYTTNWEFFLRHDKIVVNYPSFENDLVLDFTRDYADITDIPAKYHVGLVSYAVLQLMRIPVQQDSNYEDMKSILEYHSQRMTSITGAINATFGQSGKPKRVPDTMNWGIISTDYSPDFNY